MLGRFIQQMFVGLASTKSLFLVEEVKQMEDMLVSVNFKNQPWTDWGVLIESLVACRSFCSRATWSPIIHTVLSGSERPTEWHGALSERAHIDTIWILFSLQWFWYGILVKLGRTHKNVPSAFKGWDWFTTQGDVLFRELEQRGLKLLMNKMRNSSWSGSGTFLMKSSDSYKGCTKFS